MIELILGDCIEEMKKLPDNFIDSIVTDPPAGISFMGKEWDDDKGGRDNWIKWMEEVFIEVKRVLKPGGHCFVWALPRTSHWTATSLENAGFEIRDIVTHVFGSGFPKSLNVGKAIDKLKGLEGDKIETGGTQADIRGNKLMVTDLGLKDIPRLPVTKYIPVDKQWEGWGTALKPASEHWILCRKPLSEKTIADNVLKWGTGGINIDKCRIPYESDYKPEDHIRKITGNETHKWGYREGVEIGSADGRFPANFIHDGSDEVMKEFDKAGNRKVGWKEERGGFKNEYVGGKLEKRVKNIRYEDNEGSAARFFYCSKTSSKEKNEGLDDFEDKLKNDKSGDKTIFNHKFTITKNHHPTVKPIKLMTYLINMITPLDGIVLDPFMGSGSTGVAAVKAGLNFIGIEKEFDYMEIAKARIEHVIK